MLSFPDSSLVKNPPDKQEIQVWSLGQEDPLEKEIATHSNILAWKIPWTECCVYMCIYIYIYIYIYISTKIYPSSLFIIDSKSKARWDTTAQIFSRLKVNRKTKKIWKKKMLPRKQSNWNSPIFWGGMQNENTTGENCWKAFSKAQHGFTIWFSDTTSSCFCMLIVTGDSWL